MDFKDHLGFIGVVLRGQRLDEHGRVSRELDIPSALEYERQFFASEPAYRCVDRLSLRTVKDRSSLPVLVTSLIEWVSPISNEH